MQTTKITTEKLNKWQAEREVLYAWEHEAEKELHCTLTGCYMIWHKNVLVLETKNADEAVEKYNSIEG
jgi:hypothetical protein